MEAKSNRPTGVRLLKRGTLVLGIVLGTLFLVQMVLAAPVLNLNHFRVELLGNGVFDGVTSTWVYRITVTDTLPNALSHASLGLDPECLIDSYDSDGSYNTEYPASEGGQTVIKWNSAGEGLKDVGDTDTFTITVVGDYTVPYTDKTYVALKSGTSVEEGLIDGPRCQTTAVSMSNVAARSGQSGQLLALGMLVAATVTTSAVLVKRTGED